MKRASYNLFGENISLRDWFSKNHLAVIYIWLFGVIIGMIIMRFKLFS